MKAMHIVMLSRSLPFHTIGGMELIAWDLACEFVKMGVTVTFVTTHIVGKPKTFVSEGVNIVALENTVPGRYSPSWWKLSRRYVEENLMESVTSVFSVGYGAYGLLKLQSQMPKVPFLLQLHGTAMGEIISKWKTGTPRNILFSGYNFLRLLYDIFNYSRFNWIVCVGDAVMKQLNYPPISWTIRSDKVWRIDNGIDTSLFKPDLKVRERMRNELNIRSSEKVIISVSRLHKQKGLEYGLKAFAKYLEKYPSSYYYIIGTGTDRVRLEGIADKLNIKNRVLFIGALDRRRVNEYLNAADIFLFTSIRKEGLALNVLEALAAGLPVVISDHLQYGDEPSVFYCNPHRIDDVFQKLLEATTFQTDRVSFLPKRYDLSFCARQYIQLIEEQI